MEKSGKILKNSNVDLENTDVCYMLITDAFVDFLTVHDTKHLKFRVQKFESHSVFGMQEYIV